MSKRNFMGLLEGRWSQGKFPCVGLDSPDSKRMCEIVGMTHDLVGAYKPNSEHSFAEGPKGFEGLRDIFAHIHDIAPDVPVILDRKAGDIGSTNKETMKWAFDDLGADAMTVSPYVGNEEGLDSLLEHTDKGIIVLCRTSNKGAGDLQDRLVKPSLVEAQRWGIALDSWGKGNEPPWIIPEMPLYQLVAYLVSREWNKNNNCALVVGAQYPEELKKVRKIVGDMPILIPGLGFQQKDVPLEKQVEQVVSAGKDSRGQGMIINSARGIINAPDPRAATMRLGNLINQYR